jgi:hypothetical protein
VHKRSTKKEKGKVAALLLPSFPEKEGSDYYENEARYAFNVIRRQHHAGWVIGCQYGIAKQDCSEHYDEKSKYNILSFHE